jgi:hypothetical protein
MSRGMRVYTVHEPPDPPLDRVDRGERLAFVKDGWALAAVLFTPFWLLAKRIWLVLVAWLLVVALLEVAVFYAGLDRRLAGFGMLALGLLIGLEADTLQRWQLGRRGWREIGVVAGNSAEECERRFFDRWLPAQPMLAFAGFAERPPPVPGREPGLETGGGAAYAAASAHPPGPAPAGEASPRRSVFARLFRRPTTPDRAEG